MSIGPFSLLAYERKLKGLALVGSGVVLAAYLVWLHNRPITYEGALPDLYRATLQRDWRTIYRHSLLSRVVPPEVDEDRFVAYLDDLAPESSSVLARIGKPEPGYSDDLRKSFRCPIPDSITAKSIDFIFYKTPAGWLIDDGAFSATVFLACQPPNARGKRRLEAEIMKRHGVPRLYDPVHNLEITPDAYAAAGNAPDDPWTPTSNPRQYDW